MLFTFAYYEDLQVGLLLAVVLLSQADIDLRAEPAPLVIASGASSTAEAAPSCCIAKPVSRHTIAKGLWNKLLAPYLLLREKGLLDPEQSFQVLSLLMSLIRFGRRSLSV